MRVRMVAANELYDPPRKPLRRGDGQQAIVARREVVFEGKSHETLVYDRQALLPGDLFSGPAIISEYSSATILSPGDELRVDALGNLVIEVH